MAKQVQSVNIMNRHPLAYFVSVFIAVFALGLFLHSHIHDKMMNHFIESGNSFFRSNVNTDLKLNTSVAISRDKSNKNTLLVQTIFFAKLNEDGTIQSKGILIDIFNEVYFPVLFVLSLVIATPIKWKRKWLSMIFALILALAFVYFKLYAIVMDNYTYPELAVKPLPIIISQIVYLYNMTLTATGTGTNLIIGLLIWLISSLRKQEIGLIAAYVNKKTAP